MLTKAGHDQFATAAAEVLVTLSYAEQAFNFIGMLQADKDHTGHLGFEAVIVLCGRAIRGVMNEHNDTVENLVAWHRNPQNQEVSS